LSVISHSTDALGVGLMTQHEFLTPDEVAALLRLSKRRIYELTGQGVLPCLRVGRTVRFPRAAFEAWVAQGGTTPRPARKPRTPTTARKAVRR
jgi:putative molybdopterin biosynthesis protein